MSLKRSKTQQAKSGAEVPDKETKPESVAPFPIVGIGASAGGLEALEQFLGAVPEHSGMAFVVVQHLDPTRKGIMPELLQRATAMKVVQVKDRMPVNQNCVYVIPPNKDMSILRGVLHLLTPTSSRGLRLPIDFFFRSLAQDQHERSIGVILSGMGTDGTLGIRAIKETGGMVAVQDASAAKFDGMPQSAIDTGLADFVGPAEQLCAKILAYVKYVPLGPPKESPVDSKFESGLEKIIILLRTHTGHDFSMYKRSTLYRRVERRMGIHQIDKIPSYVRFLQQNPAERELLFKELLIGVTSFFRDPTAWQLLKDQVFPALFASRPEGAPLRAWTAGCSTGEEAYSLAIAFKEALKDFNPPNHFTLQVFATDLDREAIDTARQGVYPANIIADVNPERLRRFFVKDDGDENGGRSSGYRIGKDIRAMVTLAPQNLITDPPFTKLDILLCRNLLIYLSPELQQMLIPLFHYSLNPGGFLFLGSAETVGGFHELFQPVDAKWRLYRTKDSAKRTRALDFPASFVAVHSRGTSEAGAPVPAANLQAVADQLVLSRYALSTVLVDRSGDILYTSGRTGKYLEPAAGKANWNIFAMAREGLRFDLTSAFQKASRSKTPVTVTGLKVKSNSHEQTVDLRIELVNDPEALHGTFLVVFMDAPAAADPDEPGRKGKRGLRDAEPSAREEGLQAEVVHMHEELQMTREEMQTSQEEYRSTTEELQSANEELQSTNEELTTSREELQSLNEELQSVNAELQAKLDELTNTNNDMRNLLNSTEIATLFLDSDLKVRRFTPQATKIIRLSAVDTGRPITDIASDLLYPDLIDDIHEVLRTLVFVEKQAPTRDQRWFSIRIMPYRTLDNVIDGVVITFADITTLKNMENEINRMRGEIRKRGPVK